jgi:choline kinase
MRFPKTVVLNCAGFGSRLGLGRTKALLNLEGKPLIHWQLELLKDVKDVRIVVGFEAQEVINTVLAVRSDVLFVVNHEYYKTKTAASLALAAAYTDNTVISLDGDLLIHPEDFYFFLSLEEECLAYTEINTEQPCTISVVNKNKKTYITQFMPMQPTIYEWNGLVHISAPKIKAVNTHIYEMLTPYLPLPAIKVRSQEIDTISDYNKALVWLKTVYSQNKEFYVKQAKNRSILEEPC